VLDKQMKKWFLKVKKSLSPKQARTKRKERLMITSPPRPFSTIPHIFGKQTVLALKKVKRVNSLECQAGWGARVAERALDANGSQRPAERL